MVSATCDRGRPGALWDRRRGRPACASGDREVLRGVKRVRWFQMLLCHPQDHIPERGSHDPFDLLVSATSISCINTHHRRVRSIVLTHARTHSSTAFAKESRAGHISKDSNLIVFCKRVFPLNISHCSPIDHASAYWNHFSVLNFPMKTHSRRLSLATWRLKTVVSVSYLASLPSVCGSVT